MKNYAIVCLPSATVDQGLRMNFLGDVDVEELRSQHATYCEILEDFGYWLIVVPPDNNYPDSVFVEDPAVIMHDVLVRTRLQNEKRQGEEARLEQALLPFFSRSKLFHIDPPGFIEGGDVLVTNDALYIGLSARTNAEGADQLARIAKDHAGFETHVLEIPKSYLHLKGEVTFHRNSSAKNGKNIITVSEEIAHHFSGSGCELILTPPEERFGGNCISSGSNICVHADCTETMRRLAARGFKVRPLPMTEFKKIDGAMTCLSKLFTAK